MSPSVRVVLVCVRMQQKINQRGALSGDFNSCQNRMTQPFSFCAELMR